MFETPRANRSRPEYSSPLQYPASEAATPRYGQGSSARQRVLRSDAYDDMSSPLRYPTSPLKTPKRRNTTASSNLGTDGMLMDEDGNERFMQSPFSTPRKYRGDVYTSQVLERGMMAAASPMNTGPATPGSNMFGSQSDATDIDPTATVRYIYGTTVNIQDAMNTFRVFLTDFQLQFRKRENGEEVTDDDCEPFYPRLLRQMKETEVYYLNLDCRNLQAFKPATRQLYQQLVRYPQEIIPLMDHTLTEMFVEMFEDADLGTTKITVRPFNLARHINMRDLDPQDIDTLVTVKGLMIRVSPIVPDMKQAFFQCTVCDYTTVVETDHGHVEEPTLCGRTQCQQTNSMALVHNRSQFADRQVCRLQETPDSVPAGQTPQTVSMCVYDELVDVAKAGDRLEVTAIFRAVPVRVNPRKRTVRAIYRTFLDVVHIKKSDAKRLAMDPSITGPDEAVVSYDESDNIQNVGLDDQAKIEELAKDPNIYDILARSLAPSIYELDDVKKGILLQLFGGTNKDADKNGSRCRGDINCLLIGDPGTSKSQLLNYVHKIAPRGVYTSGKGSSAVGLTAYITRDPDSKQLVLESGALVLSDGGICCIDEFDKMNDSTRAVLHEVMEQQTISVAKAGIITTLNARTSICACANPIGSRWNHNATVPQNIDLPPTLISRFDLIFLMLDRVNEEEDRRLAKHLISLYLEDNPETAGWKLIPTELLTKYVSYARTNIQPILSKEAGARLVDLYVQMRQQGNSGNSNRRITATTRQLESMIRMSEAHAKLRLSQTVEVSDVLEASRLLRAAIQEAATDPRTGQIDPDLLNTGSGSFDRQLLASLESEIVAYLGRIGVDGRRGVDLDSLYKGFNEQSDMHVSHKDLETALLNLETRAQISMTGAGHHRVIKLLKGNRSTTGQGLDVDF